MTTGRPCRAVLGGMPPSPATAYDNNNEANVAKLKHQQQQNTAQGPGEVPGPCKSPRQGRTTTFCDRVRLNSLWSVWYGFFGTFLQAYVAVKCTKRFLRYSVLPWTGVEAIWELHSCLGVTGIAVILLPLFLASAVFKVGNYPNDGYKLGRGHTKLISPHSRRPWAALWRHGGPTAPFIHLIIAIALLVPRLVMEARLVQHGFLPSDALWRTDIDFMVVHHDRLVVLSFMTAASPSVGHNVTTMPPNTHANHTFHPNGLSMALHAINSTSTGSTAVLEATIKKSLAHDLLEYLKELFKLTDNENHGLDNLIEQGFGSTVSVEFLNYAIALLVYSVRYPAVFWYTNKCFGTIFSIQLLANSVQSLLAFAGMSVLYKVQLIGAYKALPLLRHFPQGASPFGDTEGPFLLNTNVTLALFALSQFLVLSSSMVLYVYGHSRYHSFLSSYKAQTSHITMQTTSGWGFRIHGAALAALLASAVVLAPLLHDLTVVYRGSLDGAVLACIVAHITTLFCWVVVWLGLTIKYKWNFKVTITVGRATVRNPRSLRLVTDVEMNPGSNQTQPLIVVGNGKAYTVNEFQSRNAIMSVVQKTQQLAQNNHSNNTSNNTSNNSNNTSNNIPTSNTTTAENETEEQIYWLRPPGATPLRTPDSATGGILCWGTSSRPTKKKQKVTFNESSSMSQCSNNKTLEPKSPGSRIIGIRVPDEDDGDYATLRELPLLPGAKRRQPEDDSASEEGKLLACVLDDNVTYASTSRDLIPPIDYEDPSPLLTPELDHKTKTNVTVHNQSTMGQTPRCLRRADSGMPPEELTPRSGSVSTQSSASPPENPGSISESSSGVHSTASSISHNIIVTQAGPQNIHSMSVGPPKPARAASVIDLQQNTPKDLWKSGSLQRNIPAPLNIGSLGRAPQNTQNIANSSSSVYGFMDATAVVSDGCEVQTVVVKPGCSGINANQSGLYGYKTSSGIYDKLPVQEVGVPAVILENPGDSTVVIRRKSVKAIIENNITVINEEPFGRATNMKMTSFTEQQSDPKASQSSSATLPHFPTQPIQQLNSYPCSTMPLPYSSPQPLPANLGAGTSCNVYPRQHTTLPTHHNGVRLFPAAGNTVQNHYVRRVQQQFQHN